MAVRELERGFVLHRRDFSNTSLLLEVFTPAHGRLPVLAKGVKGAKRGRAALGALLQPFQPLWLGWSGRGEVATLTTAEAAGAALALTGDALYCGFYVNELLQRLLGRHDPHAALFVFYQQVLDALAGGGGLDTPLRRFELRLLQELGYQLDLTRDADGVPIDALAHYQYQPERGLLPVRSGSIVTDPITGETLHRLAAETPLEGAHARASRALLRAALAPHLGERPLRSRELFKQRLRAITPATGT